MDDFVMVNIIKFGAYDVTADSYMWCNYVVENIVENRNVFGKIKTEMLFRVETDMLRYAHQIKHFVLKDTDGISSCALELLKANKEIKQAQYLEIEKAMNINDLKAIYGFKFENIKSL